MPPGAYKVEFSPTPESGLNFVTQYYQDKTSLETAEPVGVEQEHTTSNINAELQVGGEISGTVTDAWTHAPLSNIYVFAIGSGEAFAGVTDTNASGEYTMLGLATGIYKIEFIKLGSGSPYIVQYYNDESSLASANPVTASQGNTTAGIGAALVRKEPVNTAAPVVAGTPAVGQTLSCSTGTWTGSPTLAYTYAWLRNGAVIAGASGSTYVVQTADQGTGLACKVTATNKSASASTVSNTLTVAVAPPPPAPKPEVELLSTKIPVSRGSARVPIACAKTTCTGTIELTERIVVRRRHHGKDEVQAGDARSRHWRLRTERRPQRHDLCPPDENGQEAMMHSQTLDLTTASTQLLEAWRGPGRTRIWVRPPPITDLSPKLAEPMQRRIPALSSRAHIPKENG